MIPLALNEIRAAIGGRALRSDADNIRRVTSVSTDTRTMHPGCLFVAIKGERYDGHAHLPEAASKGAIAALVESIPDPSLPNLQFIQVPSTRVAMGKLAKFIRSKMLGTGVTVSGSNGKTSTKYLLHSALRGCNLQGSMSPKSHNNDIGVPTTIFAAEPSQQFLVLEVGTNHPGEIRSLTNIAQPDIAVITNVGAEHLEGLGDLMGVRQEEASVVEGLSDRGMLIVNGDDPELLESVSMYRGKRFTFGLKPGNDLFATDIRYDHSGTHYYLNGSRREVFVPLLGRHNACNSLAVIAVARRMGLDEEQIIGSLAQATGPEMRLQVQQVQDITILNDTYNANPSSMTVALETLAGLKSGKRRVAVLGEMRELGASSARYHREIGELAGKMGVDMLAFVGNSAEQMRDGALHAGVSAKAIHTFVNATDAATGLRSVIRSGDLVLVKASRSIRLEAVVKELEARHSGFVRKAAS